MLPFVPRPTAKVVGAARLKGHIHALEFLATTLPELHDGRCAQREPDHVFERWAVFMPADARTRIVADQKCLDEVIRRQPGEMCGAGSERQ